MNRGEVILHFFKALLLFFALDVDFTDAIDQLV